MPEVQLGDQKELHQSQWPVGGGEMGAFIRAHHWDATPLGPVGMWPQSLKAAVDLILHSPVAMTIGWGQDGFQLYNEAYIPVAGDHHPGMLGLPMREGWPEAAEFVSRALQVTLSGETLSLRNQFFTLRRAGVARRAAFDADCSPLFDDTGTPAGLLAILREITETNAGETKRAETNPDEAAPGEGERWQAYLLRLGDALRPLTGPAEIQAEASRLLCEELAADSASYSEYSEATGYATIHRVYTRGGVPSIAGTHRMAAFPSTVREFRSGQVYSTSDCTESPLLSGDERAAYAALGIRGLVVVPLVKNGNLLASLQVFQTVARTFSAQEIALIQETAERTWDAVERTRAEAALRQSEARLRSALTAAQLGTFIWHVESDSCESDPQMLALFGQPPDGTITLQAALSSILHPDDRARYAQAVGRVLTPGGSGELRQDIRVILPDGSERWLAVSGQAYFDDGTECASRIAGAVIDITERKRREANIAFLGEIAGELSRLSSSDEIIQTVGARIGDYLKVASVNFVDVDESANQVVVRSAWSDGGVPSLHRTFYTPDYLSEEFARANRAGETVIVCDTQSDPRTDAKAYAELSVGSFLTVPFLRGGKWLYYLTVTSPHPRSWQKDEVELFQELAARIFPRIERARDEEALREVVERYEQQVRLFDGVASTTPDFVYLFDRQGHFLYANRRLLEVWGMRLSDVTGKTCSELGYEQWHHDMHMREIAQIIETKRAIKGEVPFKAPLTGIFGVYEYILTPVIGPDGEVEIIAGTTRDVTERKQNEEALRAIEAETRRRLAEIESIYESAPVGLALMETNARFVRVNRRFAEMNGWPADAHVGKTPSELNPALGDAAETALRQIVATGEPLLNLETKASTAARPAQKLESVGLLAGGIAHDFNNLLTGIMGNASLVLDLVNPAAAERITEVINSAERAANLTRQLLAYAGKGRFVVRDIDVSEVVNEISSLVQFSIPKSVQFAVTVEKRLPYVQMDPSQLQQILMNLVINAGEAIGEGNPGRIRIATSTAEVDGPFVDALGEDLSKGRYVCIEVSDSGSGIDEETRSKIFDPFFTTKFTGRGLGLAAVAGILRSQKGAITVESQPGRGSTFRVFLPAADRHLPSASEQKETGERGTILVVDDEPAIRSFIGSVLRKRGYRVLVASDGKEALEICESDGAGIDAAILDVIMPVMGAKDLMPALKAHRPQLPILLTSGYSESEARRLCADYPGVKFIQKPYTAQQIAKAVDELRA